jgi:LysM repeat protein
LKKKISKSEIVLSLIIIIFAVLVFKEPILLQDNNVANAKDSIDDVFRFEDNSKVVVTNNTPEMHSYVALAFVDLNENVKKEVERKIAKEVVIGKGGFRYKVKKGDTLDKIARKFGISKKILLSVNNIKNENKIKVGDVLSIPISGKKVVASIPRKIQFEFVKALTDIEGLLVPTSGLNRGLIHGKNGVDIDADCGTPVYAADSGIVVDSYDGWNGGYGNYIIIQHNNYSTLYGHLSERYVNVGDYVEKGSLIGLVGNTGKVEGITGCHLHFEVRGKTNPLGKY